MGYKNQRWSYSTIDAYETLDSVKGWKKCPKCKEFPRVWIFDNGLHAKCCCGYKYDKPEASAESVGDVWRRTGSTAEYSRDNLRNAWNMHVNEINAGGHQ